MTRSYMIYKMREFIAIADSVPLVVLALIKNGIYIR